MYHTSYTNAYIWTLERWYDEIVCRAAMETQMQKADLWTWEGEGRRKEGAGCAESNMQTYHHV